ncbi:MAG: crossover junction endodeoxyribonuclease RuvC [Myxococcales bacterium]|nr:crossover junction endodeoxyribonuclease RuvC [Myxococcales bacterium]
MRVLGVDPGSRLCGYAVIDVSDRRACSYVECGVLSPERTGSAETRLGSIACWLTDVINELRPTVMAVEDVFVGKNPRSGLALAQARGSVLAVAGLSGLVVYSYAPALIKQSVTGKGNAPKMQVANMVSALLGLRTPPEADAADALAVATTHGVRFDIDRRTQSHGGRPPAVKALQR